MAILKDESDRRTSRRRSLDEIPEVTAVKVQSEEVSVVNASRGGILIECGLRLPPARPASSRFTSWMGRCAYAGGCCGAR